MTKRSLTIAIVVSVLVHIAIIVCMVIANIRSAERAAGTDSAGTGTEIIIAVDVTSGEFEMPDVGAASNNMVGATSVRRSHNTETAPATPSTGIGSGTGTKSTALLGDGGTNIILAEIREKIERSKTYPRLARRMKIEGRPTVLFQIEPDGSVKYVKLAGSSGETLLDDAAIETVKRAAPLPYFDRPIRLAIRYELN